MNNNDDKFTLGIGDASPADREQLILQLETEIKRVAALESETIKLRRERESDEHQDMGATLVAILGTHAAFALAKGIQAFIAQYRNQVDIITPDGVKVTVRGNPAGHIDVAAILRAMKGRRN